MTAVWTWMRGRPHQVDIALAAGLWLVLGWLPTGAVFFSGWLGDPLEQGLLGLAALMAAPVALRRSRPMGAFAGSCAAGILQLVYSSAPATIDVCFLFAVYAVAAYDLRRRARYLTLIVGWVAAGLCAVRWTASYATYALVHRGPTVFALLVMAVTVTWVGAALVRTRRVANELAVEQVRAAELDAERQLRLSAAQQRAQIARELHDIVAHSVAVMVVQADGGRYVAAQDPARAVAALETIAATGREAMSQMRHLLGVLRDGQPAATEQPGAPVTPQPVLADLPALLAGVRGAGVRVDERLPDPLPEVPAQLAAVAYRIVQESLTNVLKHAGPRAGVTVTLAVAGGQLRVEVRDDGLGAPAQQDSAGRGLIGMRERAALVNGRVSAGPTGGGGWAVRAALPVAQIPATEMAVAT